jgi:hypothetical protein
MQRIFKTLRTFAAPNLTFTFNKVDLTSWLWMVPSEKPKKELVTRAISMENFTGAHPCVSFAFYLNKTTKGRSCG